MNIRDLKSGIGSISLQAKVLYMGEKKIIEKYGRKLAVLEIVIADKSGEIPLTLWNSDCDRVAVGNEVIISNADCNEWQGKRQLTLGKYGTMEVIE